MLRGSNLVIILLVVAITIFALMSQRGSEFSGADAMAEEAIAQIKPDYQPWFSPVWEPPSGEIESLLFALQAALGAGFIGYYLGYQNGRAWEASGSK